MTTISKEEVGYEDIMWFGIDENGEIAQFTSGVYGNIPIIVCQSREDLDKINDFFLDDLEMFAEVEKSKNVFNYTNLIDDKYETKINYLKPSLEISQKGLYSYDSYDREAEKGRYFKVSNPIPPIKKDKLPIDIFNIINKVHFKGLRFKDADLVAIEQHIKICKWWANEDD